MPIKRQIFGIYTLLKRLHQAIKTFAHTLHSWQRDFYHDQAWSSIHYHLEIMNTIMILLGKDLDQLIYELNSDCDPTTAKKLQYKFRGHPHLARIDAFEVWQQIIARNARQKFCDWVSYYDHVKGKTLDAFGELKFFPNVEKRLIFIPSYSLLLTQIKRTTELEDVSRSVWKQKVEGLIYLQSWLDKKVDWYPESLRFFPELPLASKIHEGHTQLTEQSYILKLEVPAQNQSITDIMTNIEENVTQLSLELDQLKNQLISMSINSTEFIF